MMWVEGTCNIWGGEGEVVLQVGEGGGCATSG